jgi:hypothetical protein
MRKLGRLRFTAVAGVDVEPLQYVEQLLWRTLA